ncbi:MAG: polysaccharide biosynthesis C-terminal domain-containing protein [Flavobacteriales bacterium]|nr:polysaccharide biosynthesis C-terminal domain-containing protein [Flavobacteriales bacterium]
MGVVKKQGIANTLLVYAGTLVGAFSLLLVQPIYLSKEELGLTRLILSFATVLASLLSFGISSVTVRYLPRVFDKEVGHRGFFGFMLIYVTTSVTLGLALLLLLKQPLARLYGDEGGIFSENLVFVVMLAVSYSFVLGFNSYCLALLRSVFPTFLNDIVVRLLFIAIIGAHFLGYLDLRQFLFSFCGIYALQALIMLAYTMVVDRPRFIPDLEHFKQEIGLRSILRYGAVITFTAINSVSLKYIDSIFVGRISLDQVAVYSVAAFIGLMIEIPLNALERISSPVIAHAMAAGDMAPIRTIYQRSARFLLLLGGWMFVLVVLNVRDLLGLLPEGFSAGWPVAIVIATGALINMATGINHPILVNSDRYIYASVFLVALLVITVLGNWILIPRIGIMGAAITSCIANVVYNGLKFEFIRRRFAIQPFDRKTLFIGAVVACAIILVWLIPMNLGPYVNMTIRGILASGIYFAAIVRLRLADDLHEYLPAFIRQRIQTHP